MTELLLSGVRLKPTVLILARLHYRSDDGIVWGMSRRFTISAYVAGEETNKPRELAYGVLREPPAPGFLHQIIVGRVFTRLDRHVRQHSAGTVVMSPIDVILDRENHLVVQPDIVFVQSGRLGICRTQIWGAPDLVVEVLSMGNARRDRTVKVDWYRQYGVRECWLVDAIGRTVEVIALSALQQQSHEYHGRETVRSSVLPRLRLRPDALFDKSFH